MNRRAGCGLAVVATLAGCGPSPEEVGAAMLLAAPFIVAATTLVLAGLARLERARVVWRPTLYVLGGAAALAVGGAVSPEGGPDRYSNALFGFALIGVMYLGLTLIVWRVWRALRPATAYGFVQVPLALLVLGPAPFLAVGGPSAEPAFALYLYLAIGGLYGWPVVLVLTIGLAIETALRRRARRDAR
jgi:hypothetical protein